MSVADYYRYELDLGTHVVVPTLRACGLELEGKAVLDVGCGHGGILAAVTEAFRVGRATGIDLDEEMIASARGRCGAAARFERADFFQHRDDPLDLVLLRDVLEHIGSPEAALARAYEMLAPGGALYVTYAPFYSPFGGHQHNAANLFARVPWLQVLPEPLFCKLLELQGNSYKSGDQLVEDVRSVLRTRLTVARFWRATKRLGFRRLWRRKYFVRPDYRFKFGLPPVRLPGFYVPVLTEALCLGEEVVLRKVA